MVSALGASTAAASANDRGSAPLVSLKNLQQGLTGYQLSPNSVQERTFVNEGTGALLLDASNARQGVTAAPLSPQLTNRDVFVNHD
jgi:hypothetical protein